jgi:hypothetical protein
MTVRFELSTRPLAITVGKRLARRTVVIASGSLGGLDF